MTLKQSAINRAVQRGKPQREDKCEADIYGLEPCTVLSKGKRQQKVKARSLFCFWAVRELGVSLIDLTRRLEMSGSGVGLSAERGEAIARKKGFALIE